MDPTNPKSSETLANRRIGFVGGGAMATALAGGLCAAGVSARNIQASEPDEARRRELSEALGIETLDDNATLAASCDLVVIAVKPNVVGDALANIRAAGGSHSPLWISIAAGIPLEKLEAAIGGHPRIVRAMPNTPALVGAGATAISANARVDTRDRAAARALFEGVGTVWEAPSESMLDAVTALSGSGPAYVFLLLEALVNAGIAEGLPAEAASQLATQTVFGAAKLALEDPRTPKALREQVTSPGGTTQAALTRLFERDLPDIVADAVRAATRRSRELGA
ncbi:pyrroline-5-carboxylate reductase [Myxococcota bacterium]|nr:pyrroline-5-carboxylate reductase [Myxococcota bacterium]